MRRRTFLTTVGVGITTAVAGCNSKAQSGKPSTATSGSKGDEDSQRTTSGAGESTPTDTSTPGDERTRIERGGSSDQVLGDGSLTEEGLRRPHRVALTNQTDEAQPVSLSVQGTETASFDGQYVLEPSATVSIALTDLDTYTVQATGLEADATESLSIEPSQFTCNVTRTSIAFTAEGTFESTSLSTRMACPGVITEAVPAESTVSKTFGDEDPPAAGGDAAHNVVVGNPTGEAWTVRVILASETAPQLDGIYTIEPDGETRLTLTESGTYDIDVRVLETGTTETIRLTAADFDCNVSTTQVEVDADGHLEKTTVSTLMACPGETQPTAHNESSS
ncbi:hypothetical protein Hrd1104_06515 [Halorhabdus sp. CBA1104]|uniref:hypothetical protein n=1 Tax=Halorhabdus sp. CBA1104 TaxID=1380432 RepID=UPI0012B34CD5|nr:hypothetical protein [Halorhabdus sp. CBA1104]QGN06981.1 hypothetical protein Hrd1104_06515 [Halorhabdus sp. CBA1104]